MLAASRKEIMTDFEMVFDKDTGMFIPKGAKRFSIGFGPTKKKKEEEETESFYHSGLTEESGYTRGHGSDTD